MKNEAYKQTIAREEAFNAGVSSGISFATSMFLDNMPCNIYDDLVQRTTDYIIKEYHK